MTGASIHVLPAATRFDGTAADLRHLREIFAERHALRLPRLVDRDMLADVRRRLDGEAGSASPGCETVTNGMLRLLFNDRTLFDLVERTTGCAPIGCFMGQLRQTARQPEWKRADGEHRLAGLLLCLDTEQVKPAAFELRETDGCAFLGGRELAAGDAILFRTGSEHEFRLRAEEMHPRTFFGGTFRSQPRMTSWLKPADEARSLPSLPTVETAFAAPSRPLSQSG